MTILRTLLSAALVSLAGVGMSFQSAHALLIDSFDVTLQSQAVTGSNTALAAEAIGGHRKLELDFTAAMGGGASVVSLGMFGGDLAYSSDTGVSGEASVMWDADGAGLGGIDLTDAGLSSYFLIAISDNSNAGATTLRLDVVDDGGNVATGLLNASTGSLLSEQFLNLGNAANTDFTMVDSVTLTILAGTADDLLIDSIATGTVSEPPVVLLLGFGLAGVLWSRRRPVRTRPLGDTNG